MNWFTILCVGIVVVVIVLRGWPRSKRRRRLVQISQLSFGDYLVEWKFVGGPCCDEDWKITRMVGIDTTEWLNEQIAEIDFRDGEENGDFAVVD